MVVVVFHMVGPQMVGPQMVRPQMAGRPMAGLPPVPESCMLRSMSMRPVRKLLGIGEVFLGLDPRGTELVDIAEYDLEIYEENPEDHEHHGANWTPGTKKIEGTVLGQLPRPVIFIR